MDFATTDTVVEYGPATGVFTKFLLDHLPPSAKVVAIDTNENFLSILRSRLSDPRLEICHDSAENVKSCVAKAGRESANYVISGIPFSFLPAEVADRIVKNTFEILKPGGKFLVYQFLKPETKTSLGIHRYLPNHFKTINREIELLNVPPLWVYEAVKS